MENLISIYNACFTFLNYDVSWVELVGVLSGLWCVWLAAKVNFHTWTVGLINVVAFFIIFYQVNLYSDMLLQVFFFVTSIIGMFTWKRKDGRPISGVSQTHKSWIWPTLAVSAFALGLLMSEVHILLPQYFSSPAAYPFIDATTTVFSVYATILLIYKKVECWLFWIAVDLLGVAVYAARGIYLVSFEYAIFAILASTALYKWLNIIITQSHDQIEQSSSNRKILADSQRSY